MIPRPKNESNATTARPRPRGDLLPARDTSAALPGDQGAEQVVIGSLVLAADEWIDRVAEVLPDSAAMTDMHARAVYAAMLALHAEGQPIDGATVVSRLRATGYTAVTDAYDYLAAAAESVPSPDHVMAYADAVRSLWERREAISALHSATQGLMAGATVASVTTTAMAALGRLAPPEKNEKEWPVMDDAAAYHGVAGDLVHLIDPHTEADPAATLLQFLIAFGSAAGRNAYFRIGASVHYLNLFGCLIGATNAGRKGTSLEGALLPVKMADPEWADNCQAGGLSSGEGLIHAVRDARREGDDVIDEGVADKRLLVIETELAAPIQRMGRESNTLSAIIRQAWDCGRLRTMTKGAPVRATDAHISIIAHVTPDELRRLLTASDQTNGFANRFLWCSVRRSKYLPFGGRIDEVLLAPIIDRLRDALTFATMPREIVMDSDAAEAWIVEYRRLTADSPGVAGAMTARGAPIVRRLACVYACLDSSGKVTLRHLRAALALWDYCSASVRYVFGDAGAKNESADDRELASVAAMIREAGGSMSLVEIRAKRRKYRPAGEAEGLGERMIAAGLAQWDEAPDGEGRPVRRLRILDGGTAVSVSKPAKIEEITSFSTSTTIPQPQNTAVPPDYDGPPLASIEAEAAAEIARQRDISL